MTDARPRRPLIETLAVESLAAKRRKIVEKVNGLDADIAIAAGRLATAYSAHDKLLNDAKSQIGTAERELRKLREEFDQQRSRLFATLPPMFVTKQGADEPLTPALSGV